MFKTGSKSIYIASKATCFGHYAQRRHGDVQTPLWSQAICRGDAIAADWRAGGRQLPVRQKKLRATRCEADQLEKRNKDSRAL